MSEEDPKLVMAHHAGGSADELAELMKNGTVVHHGVHPVRQPESAAIWLVTSISDKNGSRCWGWFGTEKEAEEAALANEGDLWEAGYYPYVVVEECHAGIMSLGCGEGKVQWFHWTGKGYDGKYEKCDRPEFAVGAVAFGLG